MLSNRHALSAALLLAFGICIAPSSTPAQEKADAKAAQPAPSAAPRAPIVSPEVSADRKVTFRLRAPNAKEVTLAGSFGGARVPLTKDDQGVWSGTTASLPPEVYEYAFVVDGLRIADPNNAVVQPARSPTTSIFDIPGDPPLMHDFQNLPHGTVHVHNYRSKATESIRRVHIYTPPGYDKDKAATFPTLYLFHGSGDNDACWSVYGRANWILDNLIAQGKAKPMVCVMTDGHASNPNASANPAAGTLGRNAVFQKDLLEEVVPLVEAGYRVKPDRLNRAIIGLSMGGGQSLGIGLNHLDKFAWVGCMSSSLRDPDQAIPGLLSNPASANEKLKVLWIACGKDDRGVAGARTMSALFKEKGIRHEYVESEGAHEWPVWRKYLAQFAPLIFVEGK